jgi:hypothetical protein
MRNLVSALKITKKGNFCRSISIEGVKYLVVNKKRYKILKNKLRVKGEARRVLACGELTS